MPEKTGQEPMLDKRPARSDLTSRECSKLIGGVLEGLCRAFGVEITRQVVHYYAATDAIWDLRTAMREGFAPNERIDLVERATLERQKVIKNARAGRCEIIFGGLTGAMGQEMAELGDVRTAIQWWDRRADAAWELFARLPTVEGP